MFVRNNPPFVKNYWWGEELLGETMKPGSRWLLRSMDLRYVVPIWWIILGYCLIWSFDNCYSHFLCVLVLVVGWLGMSKLGWSKLYWFYERVSHKANWIVWKNSLMFTSYVHLIVRIQLVLIIWLIWLQIVYMSKGHMRSIQHILDLLWCRILK